MVVLGPLGYCTAVGQEGSSEGCMSEATSALATLCPSMCVSVVPTGVLQFLQMYRRFVQGTLYCTQLSGRMHCEDSDSWMHVERHLITYVYV